MAGSSPAMTWSWRRVRMNAGWYLIDPEVFSLPETMEQKFFGYFFSKK
jgi:hypothetical protein